MGHRGLDIGTNMLVAAYMSDSGDINYKMQRDAFYKIVPKSLVNERSISVSLEKRGANFIRDKEGNFIVVGEDALEIAIERNDVARRPLQKGVLSPKEKESLPILKVIIESLIGKGMPGDKVIYSVPARPVDGNFDIVYHTEMMKTYLNEMGFSSFPINEAFAVALSELVDDSLTGICLSYGAGMTNIAIIHQGDPLIEFSLIRAGDYIDESVGTALDISPSLVQLEKEAGIDLIKPQGKIAEAVSVYYGTLINYTLGNIAFELSKRKKELPVFKSPVPIIVSGGLTLAGGFVNKFNECLANIDFPIAVKEVRRAEDPMRAVARGAWLATQL
jgi:hypothetical protein